MPTMPKQILNNQADAMRELDPGEISPDRIRTYAPVTKAKFVRDVTRDYPSNPVKKSRAELYEEYAARKAQKHAKLSETKPVQTKVIEKKPVSYAESKNEWDDNPPPKPQRVAPRRQPDSTIATKKAVDKDPIEEKPLKAGSVAKTGAGKDSKKVPVTKSTTESNEAGLQELDNIMASILQEELKQIMIKVRQELPDSPATEAEEVVADRFRNAAGDDLQNAMGLNVTARLLNKHNPLYAKLHFSGKPEAGRLQSFISDHKITAFKRITDNHRDIFAARFDHIADFDKLCAHSQVKCGSATVTVIPCYKYFTSPPTIKSIYADNISKTVITSNCSSPQKPAETDKKEKNVDNAEVTINNAKPVDKMVAKEQNGAKTSPITSTKTEISTNPKAIEAKTVPGKTVKAIEKDTPKDVPVETNKVIPKGDSKNNKQVKIDDIDDMMVVDEEIGEDQEDDEEMTDQDILALMSGGIVVDECSGSDED